MKSTIPLATLIDLYAHQRMTLQQVGRAVGRHHERVRERLIKASVPIRSQGPMPKARS